MARHGHFKVYPSRAAANRILDDARALTTQLEPIRLLADQLFLDVISVAAPPPGRIIGYPSANADQARTIMDDLRSALDRLASPVMELDTGHDERTT